MVIRANIRQINRFAPVAVGALALASAADTSALGMFAAAPNSASGPTPDIPLFLDADDMLVFEDEDPCIQVVLAELDSVRNMILRLPLILPSPPPPPSRPSSDLSAQAFTAVGVSMVAEENRVEMQSALAVNYRMMAQNRSPSATSHLDFSKKIGPREDTRRAREAATVASANTVANSRTRVVKASTSTTTEVPPSALSSGAAGSADDDDCTSPAGPWDPN
ncbi:Protein of unknown function [Pyronema omphalodes CBS 100304]|uniref:Uncharacterized protein n=1 Tax=Pyronema omphalodes (strain CBS 100304) TaxID=1076935 RepID=U4L9H0_PYROM|nr:Protein of unknown function [Pyronema omphalodes CBS 100304]